MPEIQSALSDATPPMPWWWRWWSPRPTTSKRDRLSASMKRTQTLVHLMDTKTISMFGGLTLLFNTMTGPAIPQNQTIFQQSGYVIVTMFFAIFTVISSLCSLFIVEAMQAIPGNKDFQGTVEFGTLIHFYFGKWAHIAGQICLFAALESNAMASIIQSSQTLDSIIINIANTTCGLSFSPILGFECTNSVGQSLSPFGNDFMIFTYGFIATLVLLIPLFFIGMSDSIWIQTTTFILTLLIFLQWIIASFRSGISPERVPAIGNTGGFGGIIAIIMLDFSYVSSVPSWINIKKNDTSVQKTIWLTTWMAFVAYVVIGIFPALAFDIPPTTNLISVMASTGSFNQAIGDLFSLIILFPSIPVFMGIASSNLSQNFDFNKYQLAFLCYVLPILSTIPLLTGPYLTYFNIWSSLIFVSTANFVIPLMIYLKAVAFRKNYNETRELTDEQKALLKAIHWQSKTIGRFIDSYDQIKGRMLETRRSSVFGGFGLNASPFIPQPHRQPINDQDKKRSDIIATSVSTVHISGSNLSLNPGGRSFKNLQSSPLGKMVRSATADNLDSSTLSTSHSALTPLTYESGSIESANLGSNVTVAAHMPRRNTMAAATRRHGHVTTFAETDYGFKLGAEGSRLPSIMLNPPSLSSSVPASSFTDNYDNGSWSFEVPTATPSIVSHEIPDPKNIGRALSDLGIYVPSPRDEVICVENFESRNVISENERDDNSIINPVFQIEQFLLDDVPDPDLEDREIKLMRQMWRRSEEELYSAHAVSIASALGADGATAGLGEVPGGSMVNLQHDGQVKRETTAISLFASLQSISSAAPLRSITPTKKGNSRARMSSNRSNRSQLSDWSRRTPTSDLVRLQSADSMGKVISTSSGKGFSSVSLNSTSINLPPAEAINSGGASRSSQVSNMGAGRGVPSVIVEEVTSPSNQSLQPILLAALASQAPHISHLLPTSGISNYRSDQQYQSQHSIEQQIPTISMNVTTAAALSPIICTSEESSIKSRPSTAQRSAAGSISAQRLSIIATEQPHTNRSSFGSASVNSNPYKSHNSVSYISMANSRFSQGVGGVPMITAQHQHLLMRRRSLPAHPDFVCKSFRSVPTWLPIKASTLARICLVITVVTTVGDFVYNLYLQLSQI